MGGRIPDPDMSQERLALLAKTEALLRRPPRNNNRWRELVRDLLEAAERCPSTSCSYCEHMPREVKHAVL